LLTLDPYLGQVAFRISSVCTLHSVVFEIGRREGSSIGHSYIVAIEFASDKNSTGEPQESGRFNEAHGTCPGLIQIRDFFSKKYD
jgi:hypothetical protein